MAGLNKEVWVNQIMERFYPESNFLNYFTDMSSLVDNDKINLVEAGVDPEVLVNNTTYPIPTVQRVDTPIAIELDKFETKNTLVRRPEVIEYSYDQLESVVRGHRNSLQTKTGEKAIHAIAPQVSSAFTPVITTTGSVSVRDDDNTRHRMLVEDILALKMLFDEKDIPLEERYLVLHPKHVTDLVLLDFKSFKDITDLVNGKPMRFAGFGMLQFSRMPRYNRTTLTKVAFDAPPNATDTFCSVAFQSAEVMKSDGELYMYVR